MSNIGVACGVTFAAILLAAAHAFAAPASYHGTSKVTARGSSSYEIARGGCGSRGGPGYRKANGKCAGWND